MKPKKQYVPPRQTVIFGHTRRMLDETNMNAQSFALAVAEVYLTTTAPDLRHVPFVIDDDLGHCMKSNAQTLRRYMDGTVKVLPADLEDAWLQALPEPYRANCERDLARRRGLITVKIPDGGEPSVNATRHTAALTKEFSELVGALAPAIREGRFTHDHLAYAQRILNESDDVISAVLSIRAAIVEMLPGAAHV